VNITKPKSLAACLEACALYDSCVGAVFAVKARSLNGQEDNDGAECWLKEWLGRATEMPIDGDGDREGKIWAAGVLWQ